MLKILRAEDRATKKASEDMFTGDVLRDEVPICAT